jgi:plastocyanin
MRRALHATFLIFLAACGDDDDSVDAALPLPVDAATVDAPAFDAAAFDAAVVDAAVFDSVPGEPDAAFAIDAAPLAGCPVSFAGCSAYVDETSSAQVAIQVGAGNFYTPKCVRVKAGTAVTIQVTGSHPLSSAGCGAAPVSSSFIAGTPGVLGYFCTNHGNGNGGGMAGAILVEP